MNSSQKALLSNRYFFTKGKKASDDYDQFWIRYKPERILKKRMKRFLQIERGVNIVLAAALVAFYLFFGIWQASLLLAGALLISLGLRSFTLLAPTHVALSEKGLQLHWLRTYFSVSGPMIGWDRLSHVNIARPKSPFGADPALEFNVIASGIPARQRIKHVLFAPSMTAGWLKGDRCAIRFKLDGIASSDDRKRLQMALKKFLPSYRIDASVTDELNLAIRVESYTDLWLDALSASPKRLRDDALEPGTHILEGRYEIIGKIGGGGQAVIYEAFEKSAAGNGLINQSKVVLKEFVLPAHAGVNVRKRVLGNIQREAEMLKSLPHENIVRLTDFFVDDQRAYLVLEHIDGVTLKKYVQKTGAIAEREAIGLGLQMCSILKNLHSLNPPVLHRDFTPDNLMLTNENRLKLIDFNVAQQLEATTTNSVVGKHAYIPPEQFRGKATTQSDIYALGGTLNYLLTAQEPEPISASRPREVNSAISAELSAVVEKATAQKESERHANCTELKEDLVKILTSRYGS